MPFGVADTHCTHYLSCVNVDIKCDIWFHQGLRIRLVIPMEAALGAAVAAAEAKPKARGKAKLNVPGKATPKAPGKKAKSKAPRKVKPEATGKVKLKSSTIFS